MKLTLATLSLAVLLSACSDRTPLEIAPQNIRPAKVMVVTSHSDEVVHEFAARIEALQTVDLSFEVGGPLASLSVREGATVSKGTLIAALEPTAFQLAVQEAEVQLQQTAQDLSRKRKVLVDNGIAKSAVEDARSSYELQKVRLNKARESLADATLHSPFDAYVSRRYFDEHANIRAGEPVVRLLDLTRLQVVINAPEILLATIGQDRVQASWVEFPFSGDQRFDIQYYENRGEAAAVAQTYEVSFTLENPKQWNILPGMTATVHIHLKGSTSGQILIPATAVIPAADGSLQVWVYDPDTNVVSSRAITTGSPTAGGIPVSSGLQTGDQIVITGASQLQPGMQIRPL